MSNPTQAGEITLEGVGKQFGTVAAVHDINLHIAAGEFFSLLGPSGCGKTTTLRMIAGFETVDSGRILLQGEDVRHLPPHRRRVNMVFQHYALFPHLSVQDNIAFGLRRAHVRESEVRTRVGEMLELVQLAGYEGRRPTALSGGQQQRVALARALINRPAALLLDEPLGALDLKLRKQMQLELKHLQSTTGTTFVYVTHDQEEALAMSDRVAVMNGGRVEQVGAPREIYERPASAFVAGFIGVSNLMNLSVERVERDFAMARLGEWDVVLLKAAGHSAGDRVQITVRPEKVVVSAADSLNHGSGQCRVRAVLRELVYLGVTTQVVSEVRSGEMITAFHLNRDSLDQTLAPGCAVDLSWRPEDNFIVGAPPDAELHNNGRREPAPLAAAAESNGN